MDLEDSFVNSKWIKAWKLKISRLPFDETTKRMVRRVNTPWRQPLKKRILIALKEKYGSDWARFLAELS